nr:MAG: RNA-binding protein [Pseudomonadota bacterium]
MKDVPDSGWDSDADDGGGVSRGPEELGASSGGESQKRGGKGAKQDRRRRRDRSDDVAAGDERARQALEFVTRVVQQMGMDCRVRLRRPREDSSEGEINLEITGRDAGRIIGKKGQVLQALQFLVHRVVNRPGLERRHVLVDAEGYRDRRDTSLANMARRLGKQAVEEGKIITFEPMNPRDRRVVHLALAKFEGVITRSDGEGDQRRVQIIPVRRPSTPAETQS